MGNRPSKLKSSGSWDCYIYGWLDHNHQDAHRIGLLMDIKGPLMENYGSVFDVPQKGIPYSAIEICEYWTLMDREFCKKGTLEISGGGKEDARISLHAGTHLLDTHQFMITCFSSLGRSREVFLLTLVCGSRDALPSLVIVENDLVVKKFPENDLDVKKFPKNDFEVLNGQRASIH
ncbi:hypothetical protein Tco_0415423 [Tanacetum coccineum]